MNQKPTPTSRCPRSSQGTRQAQKSNKTEGTGPKEPKQSRGLEEENITSTKKAFQVFTKDAHLGWGPWVRGTRSPLPSFSSSLSSPGAHRVPGTDNGIGAVRDQERGSEEPGAWSATPPPRWGVRDPRGTGQHGNTWVQIET